MCSRVIVVTRYDLLLARAVFFASRGEFCLRQTAALAKEVCSGLCLVECVCVACLSHKAPLAILGGLMHHIRSMIVEGSVCGHCFIKVLARGHESFALSLKHSILYCLPKVVLFDDHILICLKVCPFFHLLIRSHGLLCLACKALINDLENILFLDDPTGELIPLFLDQIDNLLPIW